MNAPVMVLNENTERETGRTAQRGNIAAAKAVADIIRTTLGPRSMLKMLLDPMGGVVMTNDGNAILREVDVSHPAARSMIELSRAQDEEVGDGTTSVIILAGEMLQVAEPFLERDMHPTVIVRGYYKALEDALEICEKELSIPVDVNSDDEMMKILMSATGTKFVSRYGDQFVKMALQAVRAVTVPNPMGGHPDIDIKRYAKVEKIPGGDLLDCCVMDGVMFNKDVTHQKMRRRIENPRILLLDCPLEYKKGESATNVEMTNTDDFNKLLELEKQYIQETCELIIAAKPDIVITEKGISDLAQHYFVKANITAFRRIRKTDNNRIARATGATVVNRPEEIQESDIGKNCGLFEIRKIGDEYFTFLEKCKNSTACSILLRGGSKDVLNEIERNLQDAMQVARNVIFEPRLLPGGGATEMSIAQRLSEKAKSIDGVQQWPYRAVGEALEVIPRTLAQNCGADTVRLITQLRAKKAGGANQTWGVDGNAGKLADMKTLGIYDTYQVKVQTIKTAVESACMLLRVDDVVSGLKKRK